MAGRGCVSHCRSCGGHFTGDRAFDRHRAGDFKKGERHCIDPTEDDWFEETIGSCKVTAEPHDGVIVWRERGASERLRNVF